MMIADEKIISILAELLRRSQSNEVLWVPNFDSGGYPMGYSVIFPESRLSICEVSPQTEPDYFLIELYGRESEPVKAGGYTVTKPQANSPVKSLQIFEDDRDWSTAAQLYSEAERFVTGWDRVLADIEKSIQKQGKIGIGPSPRRNTPAAKDEHDDEDVPF